MNAEPGTNLEARLRAQETELRELRRLLTPAPRTARRGSRRLRHLAPLAVALLLALVPLTILAANPFTDLTGGVHDPNIEAIYDAGVTKGCVPDQEYCPTANVTREEMASFLARLGGLGANKPVANAARLAATNPTAGGPTYAANELIRVARNSEASADATINLQGVNAGFANPVATMSINAPGPGYVLASVNVVVRASCTCTVRAILGQAEATFNTAADGDLLPVSLTWVVPVTEAKTVNVPLIVGVTIPASAAIIPAGTAAQPNMTAIFVPFGATGAGPE